MYTSYDVLIDNTSCFAHGIYPVKRPSIPSPKKRYRSYDILDKDGKAYIDTGMYEDVDLSIEFNYMTEPNLWHEAFREAKRILLSGTTLRLSDDQNVFYKIKKVEVGDNQRSTRTIGKFTATFTLDPYSYFTHGKYPCDIVNGKVYNKYDRSKPIYKLTGTGGGYIRVNGAVCQFNQSVIIDCDKKQAFVNGEALNSAITGRYEKLELIYGINTIEVSSSYTLELIPNWRQI
jgi:phage-related protein